MGLGVLLPLVLFALPRVRNNENGLFLAALLTIMGFIVNRLNVAITGMTAASGVSYFPCWMELAITTSLVAAGFALFRLAVKHLPVFPRLEVPALAARRSELSSSPARTTLNRAMLALLWCLLLIGFVAVVTHTKESHEGQHRMRPPISAADVSGGSALSLPRDYTFVASEDSPGAVTFRHESHVSPDRPDCAPCHRSEFMIGAAGIPVRGEMSFERIHEGDLCASCHNGERAFSTGEDCAFCHSGL
jgi:c(7)-type cytochrome triheme protein